MGARTLRKGRTQLFLHVTALIQFPEGCNLLQRRQMGLTIVPFHSLIPRSGTQLAACLGQGNVSASPARLPCLRASPSHASHAWNFSIYERSECQGGHGAEKHMGFSTLLRPTAASSCCACLPPRHSPYTSVVYTGWPHSCFYKRKGVWGTLVT